MSSSSVVQAWHCWVRPRNSSASAYRVAGGSEACARVRSLGFGTDAGVQQLGGPSKLSPSQPFAMDLRWFEPLPCSFSDVQAPTIGRSSPRFSGSENMGAQSLRFTSKPLGSR